MRALRLMLPAVLAALPAAAPPVLARDAAETALSTRLPEDFRALRERPLFSPDRSPPVVDIPQPAPEIVEAPPPEPEPAPAAAAPDWELVGLLRSERVNSAIFRAPGEGVSFSLRMGESRDGWTLAEIGRFDVTLDNGQARARMRFPDGTSREVEL